VVNVGNNRKVTDVIHSFSAKVLLTTRAPKRPCNVLISYNFTAFKPLAPLDAEAKMPAAYLAAANLIGT
jgi:hypothetical protein